MRTSNDKIRHEIYRYIKAGYGMTSAINQVSQLTLNRHPMIISKMNIMGDLHRKAILLADSEWQRPSSLSDRPEVIRDLVELGWLKVRREPGAGNKASEICFYKINEDLEGLI